MASRKPTDSRPHIPKLEDVMDIIDSAAGLLPEEKRQLREEILRSTSNIVPAVKKPDITDSKAWEVFIVAFLLFLIASSIGTIALRLIQREKRRMAKRKEEMAAKGQIFRKRL